jgi:hypothetical protein
VGSDHHVVDEDAVGAVALTFIVQSVAALNPFARCNRSRNLGSQASDR